MGEDKIKIESIILKLKCKIQESEEDFHRLWEDYEDGVIDQNELAIGRDYLKGRRIVLRSAIRRWEKEIS